MSLLGLLLAFSGTACDGGGPTQPSSDDPVGKYAGRWRGNINGFDVVLDVQSAESGFGIEIKGSGTARSATGESHRLRVDGGTLYSPGFTSFTLWLERGGTGPGIVLSTTGDFAGELTPGGRTWPGTFTSETLTGGAPIFGPGQYSVTFTKD